MAYQIPSDQELQLSDLTHTPLAAVEQMARRGVVSDATVRAYCEAWNVGAFRFHRAAWNGTSITLTPID